MPALYDEQPDPTRRPDGRIGSPLECAEDCFTLLVTGPDPLAVDGRVLPGLPDQRVPLHQLRARLSAHRLRPADVDRVWAHMIVRARISRVPSRRAAWTVGCVGVALPVLARVAVLHSIRYAGDAADLEAAVIAAFVVELRRTDICVPRIPRRLRAAADRAARALADTLHPAASRPPPATPPTAPPTTPPIATRAATRRAGVSAPATCSTGRPTPAAMPPTKPATTKPDTQHSGTRGHGGPGDHGARGAHEDGPGVDR